MSSKVLKNSQVENIQRTLLSSIKKQERQYSVNFCCKDGILSCNKLVLAFSNDYWRDLLTSNESDTISILAPDYSTDYIEAFLHCCILGGKNECKVNFYKKSNVAEDEKEESVVKNNCRNTAQTQNNSVKNSKQITKFKVARKNHCPYCLKEFSYGYLKHHISNVHPDKAENEQEYQCEKCNEKFKSKGGLKAHIENTHNNKDPHICQTCQSVYLNKTHLIRHCKVEGHKFPKGVPPPKNYIKCKFCNKNISDDFIDIHIQVRHPNGNDQFKCDECNFSTKRKDSLQRHRRLVHQLFNRDVGAVAKTWTEGKEYKCVLCKKLLTTEDDISDHLIFEICKLTCNICDKKFTLKSSLDRHVKKFHK